MLSRTALVLALTSSLALGGCDDSDDVDVDPTVDTTTDDQPDDNQPDDDQPDDNQPDDDPSDDDPIEPSPDREVLANNTALFPVEIDGPFDLPAVRKSIKMTASSDFGLTVEKAFVLDEQFASSYAIVIRSNADTTLCFVGIESVRFFDEANNQIDIDEFGYVDGSVGGDFGTNTCLEPGKTGFLGGFLFDASFADISYATLEFAPPEFSFAESRSVLPGRASLDGDALVFTVDNQSGDRALLGFSKYWLLDENRDPITFGFLDPCADPQGRVDLCGRLFYDSDASFALGNFEFDFPRRGAAPGFAPSDEQLAKFDQVQLERGRRAEQARELRAGLRF